MPRAATIALVLAALIIGFVLRGERPSRPIHYTIKAECQPVDPKTKRAKPWRV